MQERFKGKCGGIIAHNSKIGQAELILDIISIKTFGIIFKNPAVGLDCLLVLLGVLISIRSLAERSYPDNFISSVGGSLLKFFYRAAKLAVFQISPGQAVVQSIP